jgi:AcrR family transcriptional regulator
MTELRGRGRPRDARVDPAVVEAMLEEVTEKGLGAATMESIAARAGVGKTTLYRRWPNKEALFYFVASQVSDVVDAADTGDLRKDLLSVYGPLEELLRPGGQAAALWPEVVAQAARDSRIREIVCQLVAERRGGAVEALRRSLRRGELRDRVDVNAVVDMMTGAFSYRSLLLGKPITNSYIRKVVDQAIDGIIR